MKKLGFQIIGGSTTIGLNAGLMKPRKGFTTVIGNKKLGGKSDFSLDKRNRGS